MKKLLFIAFLAIISVTQSYAADGRHGGGGGGGRGGGGWERGGGWGGGWVFPALIGGVVAYDLANPYYPYYPYPVYQQPYPIYGQPGSVYAPSIAPSVQYWYFCAAANAYYPYVASCPSGWRAVPAIPPQ